MILLETVKRQTTFDNEEEDIKVEELSDYSIIQGVFSTVGALIVESFRDPIQSHPVPSRL